MINVIENFPVLFNTKDKIKDLRGYILSLAIQGKLVPQDPNDEPASELLKRIHAERKRLAKEKKIKKADALPPITPDEIPFELPKGWEWVRLGDCSINRDSERIPVSKEQRANREKVYDYYGASGVIDKIDNYIFDIPLLLIGEDGANLIIRSKPIAFIAKGKYWVNNHAHVLDSLDMTILEYLSIYINAIDLKPFVTGTAQPKMNQEKMNSIIVGFPPLDEQKCIVQKVDELMAMCDSLESALEKKAHSRELASKSLANMVQKSATPDELKANLELLIGMFREVYSTKGNIKDLKDIILQLAIQGKLVPQDPKDEPASELLKQIEAEKKRLVKEKKIKKADALPPIGLDEIPFELPKGWEWMRLGSLVSKIGSGSTPKGGREVYTATGVKFIRSQNVHNQGFMTEGLVFIPDEIHVQRQGTIVMPGDLLMNITGASIGRCCIVPDDFDIGNVSQHVSIVRLVNKSMRAYIHKVLISSYFMEEIMGVQVGISREGLSISKASRLLIPIPPPAEQSRIVNRINDMMALCDGLEKCIQESARHSDTLLKAVMRVAG